MTAVILQPVAGKDTVIVVESEAISTVASQRQQDLTISEETVTSANLTTNISVTESTGADVRQAYEIEIIKSIVYGGLVESITSLGVVSSAAGGDATTRKFYRWLVIPSRFVCQTAMTTHLFALVHLELRLDVVDILLCFAFFLY